MTAALQSERLVRPLRIVVTGSSVAFYVRPALPGPGNGSYGEQLEDRLWDQGVPARVTNQAGWLLTLPEIFRQLDRRVVAHLPDVVILNVGWVECQPRLVPLRLFRWQETWRPSLNPVASAVRGVVAPPLARAHRQLAPRLLEASRWPMHRLSPTRFERELRRFVTIVRREQRCLVLLLNVNPTSSRVADVLPGVQRSTAEFSAIVDAVAGGEDDDVRLIDTCSLVETYGVDALLPDGMHFSVLGHRMVTELLTDEVLAWQRRHSRSAQTPSVLGAVGAADLRTAQNEAWLPPSTSPPSTASTGRSAS